MNQQKTPRQGTPQHVGRPIRLPKKCAPPMALVIATITTAILLVISLMVLCIALIVGVDESVSTDGDGGGGTPSKSVQTGAIVKPSGIKPKTAIQLPCATGATALSYVMDDKTSKVSTSTPTQAAILIDVTNGRVVAEKGGREKVYPASMTKVMTLLIACENATDPTALLTVTEEMSAKYKASYAPGEQGPSIATSWKTGDQITVEDALHLVIYESDTFACWLLAEHVAGSEAAFVALMNQKVSQLGLSASTHFENSTGLYHDNHYTTCYDMAAIMAEAMNNASAKLVLTSKEQYTVDVYSNGNKASTVPMYSGWYTGRLENYGYPKTAPFYAGNGSSIRLIAGKTGYETIPKNCFVTAGEHDENGTLYVCVQVGGASSKDSTYATREIYQKYAKN